MTGLVERAHVTREREDDDATKEERGMDTKTTCAGCDRTRGQWRANNAKGFERDGELYCCRGCCEGPRCFCG